MGKIQILVCGVLIATLCGCGNSTEDNTESSSTTGLPDSETVAKLDSAERLDTAGEAQALPANVAKAQAPAGVTPAAAPAKPAAPPAVAAPAKENGNPAADVLLKEYNERFVEAGLAFKDGKQPEAKTLQRLAELQKQLAELQNTGTMSNTQEQLLKATNDAYNTLKDKLK